MHFCRQHRHANLYGKGTSEPPPAPGPGPEGGVEQAAEGQAGEAKAEGTPS